MVIGSLALSTTDLTEVSQRSRVDGTTRHTTYFFFTSSEIRFAHWSFDAVPLATWHSILWARHFGHGVPGLSRLYRI